MTSTQTASSIEVAIRVRPLRGELHESKSAWRVDATAITELAQPDNTFTFDRIYDTNATTAEVYANNVRDSIVARVAQGYNGTVFAYGQTGSGKSFTMFGDANARSPGLIRLAVHDLFKALAAEQQRRPYIRTEVFVSVLEIYNEQLRDLLQGDTRGRAAGSGGGGPLTAGSPLSTAPSSSPSTATTNATAASSSTPPALSIRENEYGVYVHNALRTPVATEEACTKVIYTHAASRVSAATLMNEHSSRSHCVIRILVERTHYLEDAVGDTNSGGSDGDGDETATTHAEDDDLDDEDDGRASSTLTGTSGGGGRRSRGTAAGSPTRKSAAAVAKHKKTVISTLNMVDLAGSERVAKTGATGLRMIEGGHINKSLTTLTTVINRLASDGAPASGGGGAMPGRSGASAAAAFIPYRDSRLTHLLKTAIGGNSFTAVLCCITPAVESGNESRSTLQFASRAKKIKNKVRVNEVANVQTRLRELEAALRSTKKLLVAQTLYLWSKQLKIRKYEEQLAGASGQGVEGTSTASQATKSTLRRVVSVDGASRAASQYSPATPLMNQQQQQQMIIAQLSAQNDALREEVGTLKSQLEKALLEADKRGTSSSSSATVPSQAPAAAAAAAAAELAAARRSLQSTKALLAERETALQAAQGSLDELDGLCRELEGENRAQAEQVKALTSRTEEAESLLNAVEEEQAAQQQEIGLLRAQLQQSQAKLLEKHRGDDYLAELTKLHVEHQNLQYSYTQVKERADRDKAELMQRLHRLTEKNNSLEDDLDEAKDEAQLRNSYLWRLLSAAAQVTQGKPLTIKDTAAAVRDTQVGEAVRSLTSFALLTANGASSGSAGEQAAATNGGTGGRDAGPESVRQLQSRIRGLEEQLIAKDAQRDVIIDTKLKRIQGLVLRLHAVNVALVEEMRQCFHDNEQLFEMAAKSSKTLKKMEKAGLTQRSLESALDRARFTQPPHKPLYHN